MSAYIWAGVALILFAYGISVTCLLKAAADKAVAYKKYATYVEDLLHQLDQVEPFNERFVDQVLNLVNKPRVVRSQYDYSHSEWDQLSIEEKLEAKVISFKQVGDLEV